MFHGSMVALVTPMNESGDVDIDGLRGLVEFHIEQGTHALVVAGTTGEAATLSDAEKQLVIKHSVEQAAERLPVIAGSAAVSTRHTIELTCMAMEEGADACLIMTPPYIKPTQEGLFLHYQAIAHAAAIPQILYNVPGRTACDLSAETAIRLAETSNIIGIKEASGCVDRVKTIVDACGEKMDVYSGEDSLTKDLIALGAKGVISVTANIAPKLMAEFCNAALAGDAERTEKIDKSLSELHYALFVEANPIPVKWAVSRLGLIKDIIRLPLTPPTDDTCTKLEVLMQNLALV